MTILAKATITNIKDNTPTKALIRKAKADELPSLENGWIFDFQQHSKVNTAQTYVLTTQENPTIIEGCLIFELKDEQIPWMSFVEVAPHNSGTAKQYSNVGTCLIAFACRLSIEQGEGFHKGFLSFEVAFYPPHIHKILFDLYRKRYGAKAYQQTDRSTLFLIPKHQSYALNDDFLEPNNDDYQ